MRTTHCLIAAAFICLAMTSSVLARGSGPVGQERSVTAQASASGGTPDMESQSAADFGPWAANVDAASGGPAIFGSSLASQDSTIDGLSMNGVGSATCSSPGGFKLPGSVSMSASSHFEVDFQLGTPTLLILSGSLHAFGDGPGSGGASVTLSGPGTNYFQNVSGIAGQNVVLPLSYSGMFAPGSYTLTLHAGASGNASQHIYAVGDADFEFTFGPPPVGDITLDGVVDVSDLLAVIAAWGPCSDPLNCPADIAPAGGDGVVNVLDLLLVISSWS